VFIGAVLAALVLGFMAGLFAFRVKNRWCPVCGNDTVKLANQARRQAVRPC
jgi:ribosomal protein S27AE